MDYAGFGVFRNAIPDLGSDNILFNPSNGT
jgi:hypothetical membrane protein